MMGGHRGAGEEGSAAQGSTDALTDAPTWLVDPLDGTTNFVHRQPNVCVSIALAVQRQVRSAHWSRVLVLTRETQWTALHVSTSKNLAVL